MHKVKPDSRVAWVKEKEKPVGGLALILFTVDR